MNTEASIDRRPIRLTSLPAIIRDEGFIPIDYRLIRDAAVNGVIPAHQRRGIWHFFVEDIRAITTALRLVRTNQTVAA